MYLGYTKSTYTLKKLPYIYIVTIYRGGSSEPQICLCPYIYFGPYTGTLKFISWRIRPLDPHPYQTPHPSPRYLAYIKDWVAFVKKIILLRGFLLFNKLVVYRHFFHSMYINSLLIIKRYYNNWNSTRNLSKIIVIFVFSRLQGNES